MKFETRLKRLERTVGKGGKRSRKQRCRDCRQRPDQTLIRFRKQTPDQAAVSFVDPGSADECEKCGWRPAVTEIHETVVADRQAAERLIQDAARDGFEVIRA